MQTYVILKENTIPEGGGEYIHLLITLIHHRTITKLPYLYDERVTISVRDRTEFI